MLCVGVYSRHRHEPNWSSTNIDSSQAEAEAENRESQQLEYDATIKMAALAE